MSYKVKSDEQNKIVQFRIYRIDETGLSFAYWTYGEYVPRMKYIPGFVLPTYIAPVIPGMVHILQQFPEDHFPLERQTRTVQDVARFVAKGAFAPQYAGYSTDSWTRTAKALLSTICKNESLKTIEPRFAQRAASLIPKVHLLDQLPPVLTNLDFAEINVMVDPSSGVLTGVLDFEDARIEAFGMSIFGVYESFFGRFKSGKWSWFADTTERGQSVSQVLHTCFWNEFCFAVPGWFVKERYNESIQVAVEVAIVNRYFVRGLEKDFDARNEDHVRGIEWARGVWLGRDIFEDF